jgi:hypothetical protein
MNDSQKSVFRQLCPHAWTVIAGLLAAASLANVNLLGVSEHLGGSGAIGVRFGWPMTFLWKHYTIFQSNAWLFSSGTIIEFRPFSLIVDLIVSILLIAGTAYWVESFCRASPLQSHFSIASLLSITAWVATTAAMSSFEGHWLYIVRNHLELLRILTIGAFWFGVFTFLGKHFRNPRST